MAAKQQNVQKMIVRRLKPPVKAMGLESEALLSLIERAPLPKAAPFVLIALGTLTEEGALSPPFVKVCRKIYKDTSDKRFVSFIFPFLTDVWCMSEA